MAKEKRKQNPYAKTIVIQTRVDFEEMQEIEQKAIIYSEGEVSDLIRKALKAYKPLKKESIK